MEPKANYVHLEDDKRRPSQTLTVSNDGMYNYTTSNTLTVSLSTPEYVGGYIITPNTDNYYTQINFTKKPSAWHRFWTKVFLGWTWRDN